MGSPKPSALAGYQDTRDRLSSSLYDVTESVASYDWDLDQVRTLLRGVSSAMSDEVDHLESLPDRRARGGTASLLPASRARD